MLNRLLVIAILGVVAGGLAALLVLPGAREGLVSPKGPVTTGKALVGGPFQLVDHDGKAVTERDYLGKPMLVMFGFTHCPDICPSGLQVMAAALDALGEARSSVTPLFVTLDPERDTPAALKDYVRSFHPEIVGLTGSLAAIDAAAKAYRVYYKKVPVERGEGYTIDHSSFFYVMNASGTFVAHAPHTTTPDALAIRLKSILR